jgi:hypothetical protein
MRSFHASIHACNEPGESLASASIITGFIPYKNQFVVIESGKLNSIGGEKKKNTLAAPIATQSGNRVSLQRRIEDTIST